MRRSLALLVACLMPLAAFSEDNSGACRPDVERFCRQAQGDPKAASDCLLDHQQDISDACYDKLKQQMSRGDGEARPADGRVCRQDAETLCKGIQPGGGRIVNCLLDHPNDLSQACYDQLAKRAKRKPS